MRKLCWTGAAAVTCALVLAALAPGGNAQPTKAPPVDRAKWEAVVGKAIEFLKTTQEKDGGWSTNKNPGVAGIVLTGLLRTGKVTPKEPMAERALKYIESLVNPKAKHIAGNDPKVQLQNYVTSVNVMALSAAKRADRYEAIIGNAVTFLKQLQWDEGEGKTPQDAFYGGAGYDSKSRPDLSNTQFFLDALKAAGVSKDDPALKKALIFVSRCQNLKGEHNDQPWAGRIGDGSFIYTAATGGVTKVIDNPGADDPRPGYASMTYAGIKSLIYAGVSKEDERVKKAFEWIRKNYSVDANPGMPEDRKEWGLYYYYNTMAKCLAALELDYVIDAAGKKHNWRADILAALERRQRPDGSWSNNSHWMEADPNLVTGYALMALSYCNPKD
ncbi:MAG TPA: prenyltransferase/squalene oxidase repeat-containing protein [Gemmataceae bacterium]|nr:prenyltransferase/squalene oxidase repeat-containing protein [Gemmataceae bacterium]